MTRDTFDLTMMLSFLTIVLSLVAIAINVAAIMSW